MSAAALPRAAAVAGAAPRFNPWFIALTVTLATFMEVLDTSIANVALPHIAGSLSASHDEATWVLTSYLVANAIALPLSGWMSNLIGRKRYYMLCVLIFTVSSALCGMATSLGQLIFFRILQGIGGGGLQPSEQAILVDTFPGEKRGMAMAVYGMAVLVAPILGPTLGGWITDNYSWRWIFYINLPIGAISLVLSSIVLEDPPDLVAARQARRGKPLRIDAVGLGLLALGLGALEIIYDKGQQDDWFGSHFIVALMVIAGVSLVAVIFWEWNHPEPIINLRVFLDRNFTCASLVIFCAFIVLYGTTILLPQMLQTIFGYSATRAGLVLSPGGIFTMMEMPLVGYLLGRRLDARVLIVCGLATVSGASYWLSTLNLDVSPMQLTVPRIVQMLGMGMIFAPLNTAAYLYIPRSQTGNATGLFNLVRNEAASIGIAAATTLLARRSQFHQARLIEHIDPFNPAADTALASFAKAAAAAGLDAVAAQNQAMGLLYRTVQRHAMALTYFELFHLYAIGLLMVIPLVFLMKRSVAQKGEMAVH